ncbi:MAG: translesion error-prone DNA polymerase V autoproteolytic subunit [Bdellovibrionales bacterium]|nr:translesion error-prone DNA polymerase V autoproteolytic subunit [Bdellovibrionales bacterium]
MTAVSLQKPENKKYKSKPFQNVQVPFYLTAVSCGFPSPAEDSLESPLDLNEHLISKPAATFFVRAKGESMIGAGIFDGDLLIIDRSRTPQSGNVVLAILDGEFTLKRFKKIKETVLLCPENEKFPPIKVNGNASFSIWGVAIHCIHKLT